MVLGKYIESDGERTSLMIRPATLYVRVPLLAPPNRRGVIGL